MLSAWTLPPLFQGQGGGGKTRPKPGSAGSGRSVKSSTLSGVVEDVKETKRERHRKAGGHRDGLPQLERDRRKVLVGSWNGAKLQRRLIDTNYRGLTLQGKEQDPARSPA
ncbi:hypothetical protein ACJJTC_007873 [Scirpophaga incertulas]